MCSWSSESAVCTCWANLLSCRRGTQERFTHNSSTSFSFLGRKVLEEAFVVAAVAIMYCYCLLLLFTDILLFWCFEILGFVFFSWWGENYVNTLPMWFVFIHISELFRSAVLNPLCRLGSPGEVVNHSDAWILHRDSKISRRWCPGNKTCLDDVSVSQNWEPLTWSTQEKLEVKILRIASLHGEIIMVFSYPPALQSSAQLVSLPSPWDLWWKPLCISSVLQNVGAQLR